MRNSQIILSLLSLATAAYAGERKATLDNCEPKPPATCYPADCSPCFCLGPDNYQANAPANPKTCNGDFTITAAVLYWTAHQDGMEYAIDNSTRTPNLPLYDGNTAALRDVFGLSNLIDAEYKVPKYSRDFGFKVGVGYASPCDGWDIGIIWTQFQSKACDHIETELDDNHSLIPLWSAFSSAVGYTLYATDIETEWKLGLNLVDIELGRNFWASHFLSIRPHLGLRLAQIDQNYMIHHKGGSWGELRQTDSSDYEQPPLNNEVDLSNDYQGFGVRAGLDSFWHFGCGWGLYGNVAASIIYGRFSIDHDEANRTASSPFSKTKILESRESFQASRAILDLGLGIQWSSLICDCNYGITAALGWEKHLFFHQNQMWRAVRTTDVSALPIRSLPNNKGENVFSQRRGDLDTQGWTLSVKFDF